MLYDLIITNNFTNNNNTTLEVQFFKTKPNVW